MYWMNKLHRLDSYIFLQDDDQSSDNETVQTNATGTGNEPQAPIATVAGPMPPIAGLKPANNAEKPLLRFNISAIFN